MLNRPKTQPKKHKTTQKLSHNHFTSHVWQNHHKTTQIKIIPSQVTAIFSVTVAPKLPLQRSKYKCARSRTFESSRGWGWFQGRARRGGSPKLLRRCGNTAALGHEVLGFLVPGHQHYFWSFNTGSSYKKYGRQDWFRF